MPLSDAPPIAFIPTTDMVAARSFYEGKLGLRLVSQDDFALVFRIGPAPGIMLRVFQSPAFTPAPFTLFGWEVSPLDQAVDELRAKGIAFLRYSWFQQDDRDIWQSPSGARIAWFQDPEGNTLSLSQHRA